MKTFLVTLLLAVGISCAPPLELDPVTTTAAPLLETTTNIATEDLTTTDVPTVEITTTQKLQTITTTSASIEVTTLEQLDEIIEEVTKITTELPMATSTVGEELTTTTTPTITTIPLPQAQPTQPPRLSGKERESLISYLGNVDLTNIEKLVLTPRQKLAITQELEYQQLGLAPFTDPTPWQRLTREQQQEFNRKYLALRSDLQEYSRNQFLSLPEDRQAHAYGAFLSLDLETLSGVIESELQKEQEAIEIQKLAEERERQRLEQKEQQQVIAQREKDFRQRNSIKEQPRNQQGRKINGLKFNQIELRDQQIKKNRKRPNFDPRRGRRPFQQQQHQFERRPQQISQFQQQLTSAERLHFQQADAQLQEAIRLQGCLANPSACS
eukprot:TRINITY_DN1011_c0_g1_i2.p1 TRINITY_DN1011_c0_g1~~TRINITY_DN1011_c0_g1_i2.p1  ORF type:complete len:383 (-),score=115.40 TRINITY_DN1011_c0_g1_i2:98-1246(-)